MTAVLELKPVTPTEPKPGYVWQYLLVNEHGHCAAGSRHSTTSWHDIPWDFGQPVYFARMPSDVFQQPQNKNAPVGFELVASVAA